MNTEKQNSVGSSGTQNPPIPPGIEGSRGFAPNPWLRDGSGQFYTNTGTGQIYSVSNGRYYDNAAHYKKIRAYASHITQGVAGAGGPEHGKESISNEVPPSSTSDADAAEGGGSAVNEVIQPDMQEATPLNRIQLTDYLDQVPQQVSLSQRMLAGLRSMFAQETVEHTLKDILGRPIPLNRIVWDQSAPRESLLVIYDLPDLLWQFPQLVAKVRNFQYMKCTVNIRFALNAMQFHQGRLMAYFEPLYDWRVERTSTALQYTTGLQNVQMDPNKHQTGVISCDLTAPLTHWSLSEGQYVMGRVNLQVLSPLSSAVSSQTVSISPTMYLTNIELGVPSSAEPVTVQFDIDAVTEAASSVASFAGRFSQKGDDEAGLRPVSGALHDAAKFLPAAGKLGGTFLPSLAEIGEIGGWVAGWLSKAARYFGYNKPTVMGRTYPTFSSTGWTTHVMDGQAQAIKFSGAQDQVFPVIPDLFGTDTDEMDICYVASKLNYLTSFSLNTSAETYTLIEAFPVHPGLCRVTRVTAPEERFEYQNTHLSYVSSLFRRWTGAIKFRICCVSTQYHAGRILISYQPNFKGSWFASEYANSWSIVWDISDQTEVEFEIPWASNVPAKQVFLDNVDSTVLLAPQPEDVGVPSSNDLVEMGATYANGSIYMTVLTPLVAAETAASSVEFQVFIGAGTDFELFQPEAGNYWPVFSGGIDREFTLPQNIPEAPEVTALSGDPTAPMHFRKGQVHPEEVEIQSNIYYKGNPTTPLSMLDQGQRLPAAPLFPMTPKGEVLAAALVAGEKWKSLRQLTKRSFYYPTSVLSSNEAIFVDPSYIATPSRTNTFFVLTDSPPTILDRIGALYAGMRGNIRYTIQREGGGGSLRVGRSPISVMGQVGPYAPTVAPLPTSAMSNIGPTNRQRYFQFDVPVTSVYPWLPIKPSFAGNARLLSSSADPFFITTEDEQDDIEISQAAADDFTFGVLVGAPLTVKASYTLQFANGNVTLVR